MVLILLVLGFCIVFAILIIMMMPTGSLGTGSYNNNQHGVSGNTCGEWWVPDEDGENCLSPELLESAFVHEANETGHGPGFPGFPG